MSTVRQDATPEDPSDQNAILMRKLSVFVAQAGRTGFLVTLYGFLSIVFVGAGILSQDPLLFGGTVPLFISGFVNIWIGIGIWKVRSAVRTLVSRGNISAVFLVSHSDTIVKFISRQRQLKSIATLIFGIGIIILVLSCVSAQADSIIGLSLAMVIQFGLLGVIAMMITFWLEIYLHELERHLR